MDFNVILDSLNNFSSTNQGKVLSAILNAIFSLLYPANAPAAHPIEIPR
ncbi:hypothetical protein CAPI_09035 [Corynebacterium capitovis DSM 44611]|nr:hypothetical protein [Corynebacterium capitovis]WKD58333.1 hypothetical protein CAPI_09035 [Corynebacterium capitovis DSM 44611]